MSYAIFRRRGVDQPWRFSEIVMTQPLAEQITAQSNPRGGLEIISLELPATETPWPIYGEREQEAPA